MNDNIAFDNFLITDDPEVAKKWTDDTWEIKKAQQIAPSGSVCSVFPNVLPNLSFLSCLQF